MPVSVLSDLFSPFSLGLAFLAGALLVVVARQRVRIRALEEAPCEGAEAAQLFRAMFENAPYAVAITDLDGRYLECNEAFLKQCGVPREELGSLFTHDMVQSSREERDRLRGRLMRDGRLSNCEASVVRPDGRLSHVLYSSSLVNYGGRQCVLSVTVDITSRRQAEEAALDWRRKFDLTTAAARLVFYEYDIEGDAIIWSGSLKSVLGYHPDEMDGGVRIWQERIHPEDVQRVVSLLDSDKAQRTDFFAEYRLRRKDGTYADVSEYGRFFGAEGGAPAEMLGIIQDVSARRKAERDLLRSEEKFSSIFRLSPDAIMLCRLDSGHIEDVNDAFCDLFGYAKPDITGKTTQEIGLHSEPEDRRRFLSLLRERHLVRDYEFTAVRSDGEAIPCLLSSQVLDLNGIGYAFSVIRNIQEMKRMQQLMIQTEKMQSLGSLAAGMAHEINNPLGIIVQSVQNATRRLDPREDVNIEAARAYGLDLDAVSRFLSDRNILRYLGAIREAGDRAASIVSDMLSFSRRSESVFSAHDLGVIVRKALELAAKDYDLKKKYDFRFIRIETEFDATLPLVPCVATEMEQVLLNLFRNAAQAMNAAETVCLVIAVRTMRKGEYAVIEVTDNGPGIPREHLSHVFEPFFTTKKAGEGSGLGLAVSYFIVTQNHRGHFSVISLPQGGACFQIALPLRQASPLRVPGSNT